MKEVQVQALETQATKLRDVDPDKEHQLSSRKVEVEERFNQLLAPLVERRKKLDQFKRVQQVCCISDLVINCNLLCICLYGCEFLKWLVIALIQNAVDAC